MSDFPLHSRQHGALLGCLHHSRRHGLFLSVLDRGELAALSLTLPRQLVVREHLPAVNNSVLDVADELCKKGGSCCGVSIDRIVSVIYWDCFGQ